MVLRFPARKEAAITAIRAVVVSLIATGASARNNGGYLVYCTPAYHHGSLGASCKTRDLSYRYMRELTFIRYCKRFCTEVPHTATSTTPVSINAFCWKLRVDRWCRCRDVGQVSNPRPCRAHHGLYLCNRYLPAQASLLTFIFALGNLRCVGVTKC